MDHLELDGPTLETVEMHTCGEPTRIVIRGYPKLQGTLLEQRRQAQEHHDHIRKRLMLEPRGHGDMYGAILVHDSELVSSGEADIGVLFCHCEGYSLMCGHGTVALGRFLVDSNDLSIFPRRNELKSNIGENTISLNLHAPCGIVRVTIPTTADGRRSDGSRPVSFLSVPSFVTALNKSLPIRDRDVWPALKQRGPPYSVRIDISYGGTFFALVSLEELGLGGGLQKLDLDLAKQIAASIKQSVIETCSELCQHPSLSPDQWGLYSVIIMDKQNGLPAQNTIGAELGICVFADGQIDRSPTGSGVTARVAAAHAAGDWKSGSRWAYHSLVSQANGGAGAFIASISDESRLISESGTVTPTVTVAVEGQAFYIGMSTYICEEQDRLGGGFLMSRVPTVG